MILTKPALENPTAAIVAALLVLVFSFISLSRLPVQLIPEIERPEITISTNWKAASPEEVESGIIEPQEKGLRGTPGMTRLISRAQRGRAKVTLKFKVGTDLQRALVDVLNRLNRISGYPDDVSEPKLSTIGERNRPIAWFIFKSLPENEREISSYHRYLRDHVQTRFERVPGVALSESRGGVAKDLLVEFDPYKLAALGIDLPSVASRLARNEDVSAGFADVGKRRYTIRYSGSYPVDQIGELVIDWRDGLPVLLRDIANVSIQPRDRQSLVINQGQASMAFNVYREPGVNVLEVMDGLKLVVDELREPLRKVGVSVEQVYDETIYIDHSINMLTTNLAIGILLAVAILWWFLKNLRATLAIAVAIPLCLASAFIVLDMTGHTLNIISLAGLAFAVGMVLDSGIVVLENIIRLREQGMPAMQAALEGASQVWGALLASTATTVAVFIPVVFLQDEAGQLFSDLAIAISAAVVAALLIAVVLLPVASKQWLTNMKPDRHASWWSAMSAMIMQLTGTPKRRLSWIVLLIGAPMLLSWWLLPEADYLPGGNRNRVTASIQVAPGVNFDTIEKEMGRVIAKRLEPYLTGEKQPQIKHYFFVVYRGGAYMGVRAVNASEVDELVPVVNKLISGFPDSQGFARRSSLFGGAGADSVDINLQSRHLEALLDAGKLVYEVVEEQLPGASITPRPNLEMAEPELFLVPDERRIAEAGWTRATMGSVVKTFGSGLTVGEYFDGERRRDIVVRSQSWKTPEELSGLPVYTPEAGVLPLGELVAMQRTAGPSQIRRVDRRRTVTLQIRPPDGMSVERLVTILKNEVEPKILPLLPEDGSVSYGGTAEKLSKAFESLGGSFLLATLILHLLMSALFRSFIDSLLVLVALPLAAVGGVLSLHLVNLFSFQAMDLLTMIGFIILLGLVVNNAILLVYQTRSAERQGTLRSVAVKQAVQLRLRPILMSTLTSLFGMLPLLLVPGAGTELYRGLAAVIVGGLAVSTLFTLLLLPSLLRLGEKTDPATSSA